MPYDDRVQGYHNREDARKEDPLLATAVFNVGGTYYGEYNCSKEAELVDLRLLEYTITANTGETAPGGVHHTDSEEEGKNARTN